jgi:hypothetical protein
MFTIVPFAGRYIVHNDTYTVCVIVDTETDAQHFIDAQKG